MNQIIENIKSFFNPEDRILSARSLDGITWFREKGIRIESSEKNPITTAFYCFVHQPVDLNGFYEMFYHSARQIKNTWKTRISRIVSPDGLNWGQEPLTVLDETTCSQPLTQIRAPYLWPIENGWRLYFSAKDTTGITHIYSARSENRIDWSIEPGARIEPEMFPAKESDDDRVIGVSDTSITRLPDDRLRMYFSSFLGADWKQNICSAVSQDGLNWSIEEGIRINFGPHGYRYIVNNPAVIQINGKWKMYFRGSNNMPIKDKIFHATSSDGLTWEVEGIALAPNSDCRKERHEVAHPFVFQTSEGFYRLYYTGCCGTILNSASYAWYENFYREMGIEILYD
jgi:predicted GH43/DUF377 family glycosyl hydrolase